MRKIVFIALALTTVGFASAVELVTNGNFESNPLGFGWTEASAGQFQIIGDWSGGAVDSSGDFGPPTNTAWLGGYDDADDSITQSVSTLTGVSTATLAFDFYFANEDIAGFDFFTVSLGNDVLDTIDLGNDDAVTLTGPAHLTYNVTSLMNGSAKDLVFRVTTDSAFGSSAFVDNVSISAATVPEPATMAAIGLGIAALLRRRRK